MSSGVYLRNQNQTPVASFVATPSSTSRTVLLNASASSDFEGRTLNYYWFKQALPDSAAIDCGNPTISGSGPVRTLWGAAGFIGEAITLSHTFAAQRRARRHDAQHRAGRLRSGRSLRDGGRAAADHDRRADPDMTVTSPARDPHEAGSILVVAVVLMSVMLTVALASFSFVDGQQQRAREQRERETSLNLTEASLYSQGFALAQTWPGNAAGGAAMPTTCTSAVVQSLCPNPNTLAAANSSTPASANFTNGDASANVTWTTRIRDNGAPIFDAFDFAQVDATQTGTNVSSGSCVHLPGALQVGCQRRSQALGAGARGRARPVAQPRRAAQARAVRRGVRAQRGDRGELRDDEQRQQGDHRRARARRSSCAARQTTAVCTDYDAGKGQVLPADDRSRLDDAGGDDRHADRRASRPPR